MRGVHDAKPIGGFGVVDLIKVLVDDLEKGLLFGVAGDLGG